MCIRDRYKLEELPFITSICSIFPIAILFKSKVPDCLPIRGRPSIRINMYSESNPWIWIPSPPPKSGTIIIPVCSSKTSLSLLEFISSISFLEISLAGNGSDDNWRLVLVPVTITSSNDFVEIESLTTCAELK